MALLSTAGATAMVSGLTGVITHMACHTASPGTTGTSEYAGVTRQAVSWSAGANTGALTFTTSGASAVTHLGGWSASTAGTYEAGYPLTTPVTAVTITFAIGAITNTAS